MIYYIYMYVQCYGAMLFDPGLSPEKMVLFLRRKRRSLSFGPSGPLAQTHLPRITNSSPTSAPDASRFSDAQAQLRQVRSILQRKFREERDQRDQCAIYNIIQLVPEDQNINM